MRAFYERYDGGVVVDSRWIVASGLNADKQSITADGTDTATIHWAGFDQSVTWDCNGDTATDNTTPVAGDATGLREATLSVTAAQAGPIDISVGADTLTIEAV